MKKKEWNEGLDHIDPDLVEKYVEQKDRLIQKNKKSKGLWLRVGAVAACFLLIVSAVIVVPMLRGDDPGVIPGPGTTDNPVVNPPDYTPIIFDATVSPEQLNGNSLEFIVGSSVSISGGESAAPPAFQFSRGIAVKAKVVKNHPDKYYKLDVSSEYRPTAYRLIQMETIEVIRGENVPPYFLYLIPEYVYVDMSVYDSLLISMSQIGVENYVLKNATQNRMESFELPVFADYQDNPELGNIIAFTDGIFDTELNYNTKIKVDYKSGSYEISLNEDPKSKITLSKIKEVDGKISDIYKITFLSGTFDESGRRTIDSLPEEQKVRLLRSAISVLPVNSKIRLSSFTSSQVFGGQDIDDYLFFGTLGMTQDSGTYDVSYVDGNGNL